ncbi:MAG: Sua5/YciO/YrdC/YwlC family protein [bacterium]|nr:Sua5/YciO/YrdC/YwlC family protein [bacterium]
MEKAIEALRNGGIILYPTDTTWALGCDARNENACQRIQEITGSSEGMLLLVDGFPMVERYVPEFPEVCYDLVDFATKPLTVIYPNAKELSPQVLGKDGSVGIRITQDSIGLKLIRSIRKPLVAAGIPSGQGWLCRKFDDIPAEIVEKVDAIVEERQNEKMKPLSQIIKIGLGGEVKVLRK